jgi:hypothetical protein
MLSSTDMLVECEVVKDITKIPGYYKKKHSHEIQTTNDFIHKMRKTGVLQKFFTTVDVNFAGVKDLFRELY